MHLDNFIIADDVTLEDLTPTLATISVEGPKSSNVLVTAVSPILDSHYGANVEWGAALVARLNVTGSPGFLSSLT